MSSEAAKAPVAIVGLACCYPGAHNPTQFWENILARRRQFRRLPDCRLPLADYHDPDPAAADKTYALRAAVIDGFEFDWASRRIPFSTFRSCDIAHWLALETALGAIADAGYDRKTIPNNRTGVIVGNTLTGEQTRANTLRLRWPFVHRALRHAALNSGLGDERIEWLATALETHFKSVFPPVTEDSLAGGLSNTIAGRICNFLNLYGGGYTIDGACASSLLAVATAASRLTAGDLDLAIAGGVDISLDPFELIGFAKAGALTRGDMTVYDRGGSGFLPGEGCGFVVLKRLADARRDKDYVYAQIHGWGISSDGGGAAITAPSAKGQARAIKDAYAMAPYPMSTLDFIEGHGTGTTVGDRTELEGISLAMEDAGPLASRACGMTSLKSIIGHTKAASGIGGLIKAVLAVHRRVLPPIAACREPHPVFDSRARALFPIRQGQKLAEDTVLRAGVAAMGFGGINCHVTIESGDRPDARWMPAMDERRLMASSQESELFVVAADTLSALQNRLKDLTAMAKGISIAELTDLAAKLGQEADQTLRLRAAVTADDPDILIQRWEQLNEMLRNLRQTDPPQSTLTDPTRQIWIGQKSSPPRIAFLFPGQGSQQLNMGRLLVERFQWARDLADLADDCVKQVSGLTVADLIYRPVDRSEDRKQIEAWNAALSQTQVAQPAICLASVLWLRFLEKLGVRPAAVGGHSLGELTAFGAAGVFDARDLLRFAALRGNAMARSANRSGAMVSLKCDLEKAEALIRNISDYLIVANINSPTQMVLSGEASAVDAAIALASAEGILSRRLNVSSAFHSQLAAPAAEMIDTPGFLPHTVTTLACHLFTSTDGSEIQPGTAVAGHFVEQLKSRVNFSDMVRSMSQQCDLFLEVGPGRVLSGLVHDILSPPGVLCLPLESTPALDQDLNRALGALFAYGADIHWPTLYRHRLVRPFVAPAERHFIENPCERPFEGQIGIAAPVALRRPAALSDFLGDLIDLAPDELSRYLATRGPFIAQVIQADLKYAQPQVTVASGAAVSLPAPVPVVALLPSPASPATVEDFQRLLTRLVHEVTGYPEESISLSARLLDELNLDSIKAGDLLLKFSQQSGVTWPSDPNILANASLQEILAAVIRLKADQTGTVPAPEIPSMAAAQGSPAEIAAWLFSLVKEMTGFPEDSLSLEARLLDDLNLDSIKSGDLIARAAQRLGVDFPPQALDLTRATLGDIVQLILAHRPPEMLPGLPLSARDPLEILLEQASQLTGFTKISLDPDALVEKDLHIGPDMLRALLQRTAILLGTQIQVDLPPLRTRSLRQIAQIFERILKRQETEPRTAAPATLTQLQELAQDSWVRNFGLDLAPSPLSPLPDDWGKRREDDWQSANILILHRLRSADVAEALADALFQKGAQVKQAGFRQARAERLVEDVSFSHLIAILPRVSAAHDGNADLVREAIEQLAVITVVPPASAAPRPRTTLTFVQFGGGFFGMAPPFAALDQCCATALAASLHLERSDLRVRVLDFSPALEPSRIAAAALSEIQTPEPFAAAGYDFKSTRRVIRPFLTAPSLYPPRSILWSDKDVMLVSGGAKGITAACALAVAKATGVRTALIGRSPHPSAKPDHSASLEIGSTLQKFSDRGLTADYFCCDVTNADSVQATFGLIRKSMGPITAIIHGAGLNLPRLARQVSAASAFEETAPKVLGLMNLLSSLGDAAPKLIVGLSSIIGLTGMPGNAWYGFSNEALDVLLRRYAGEHPQTRTLSVAYSIWRDEGMGARMGSVQQLRQKGIHAIDTSQGVERFVGLFLNQPPTDRMVVTARIAGLDTWHLEPTPPLSGARFLEQALFSFPQVESIFKTHLSLESDPYLKDHQFQGSYLFPTVFGLEAMAQAAFHAAGLTDCSRLRIENIRLERPITVDPLTGADILVHATLKEPESGSALKTVEAGIVKLQTGITSDFFSARFIFGLAEETDPADIHLPPSPCAILPESDLYRPALLFQGPAFQRIETIWQLSMETETTGQAIFDARRQSEPHNLAAAFGDGSRHRLVLGDPFFRDSLLQAAALLIPQDTSLPVQIERLDIFRHGSQPPGAVPVKVQWVERTEREIEVGVTASDRQGNVIERLQGYRLRILKHHDDYPATRDLTDPQERDTRLIRLALDQAAGLLELTLPEFTIQYHPGIHGLPKEQRHAIEAPQLSKTAARLKTLAELGESALAIQWLESGKPTLSGAAGQLADLSLSHDDRLCLCVAGQGPTACDIAPITPRTRKQWAGLLGPQKQLLIDALLERPDSLDRAGTRIWAAAEVGRKLGSGPSDAFTLLRRQGDAVLWKTAGAPGEALILTLPLSLTWGPEKILAVTAAPRTPVAREVKSDALYRHIYRHLSEKPAFDMLPNGPQGQMVFVQRRPVTFKPSAQLSRTIYFANYINWMGEVREASVWPIMSEIHDQLTTGRWGSVTNSSQIKILGEGSVNDMVETRMWASDNSGPEDSTMTLSYDFRKITANGENQRLAFCRMQTTWVEIVGQGLAKARPYPPYLKAFMADMLPKFEAPDVPEPLPEPLAGLLGDQDEPIYQAPGGPTVRPLLLEKTFDTTLSHANMVGNIYYATYYDWQGQTRDRYFYDIIPEYYRGIGERGELICLESRVDHLREAMPFDRILTAMALKELRRSSILLHVDYYRLEPDGSRIKLAHGLHKAAWVVRDKDGNPHPAPWPPAVTSALGEKINRG